MLVLPPPINNIGEVLHFSVRIPLENDINPDDNQLEFAQNLIGSLDPNDKTCLEGDSLSSSKLWILSSLS